MKILMLNYEFPPLGGGAGAVTRDLGIELVRRGHAVDCVTMRHKDLAAREDVGGIRVFRTPAIRRHYAKCSIPETFSYLAGAALPALRLAKKERYDLVHCHFSIPTGPLAWLLKLLRKTSYVITCHGADVPGTDVDRFQLVHHFTGPVNRFVMKRAAAVVSPSQWMKEYIDRGIGDYGVKVIPNGIYIDRFPPKPKKPIILMVGRLVGMKNFDVVLRALEGVTGEFRVEIVGDGPMRQELEQLASRLALPVKFHGWLPSNSEELRNLYSEAAIFCLPAGRESFGIVFMEAMSAGCAVIGARTGAVAEVISENDSGLLVPPRDVDATKAALLRLMGDAALRDRFAQAGIRRVRDLYSWQAVTDQYLNLFESVVHPAASRFAST